ncbi:uncharacterized protein [Musca autumnalis]|uniref:uncharacterized protein n=1 Tax=Musca autumnalis TaxID=221902 RepID=UPI003CE730F9
MKNLQGYVIKVAVGNNPPRAQIFKQGANEFYIGGIYCKLLRLFAQHYNASLEFVYQPYEASYSLLQCIRDIKNHTVDTCADGISYSDHIMTTRSPKLYSSILLVPYDEPLELYHYFLRPFRDKVWALLIVSFITAVLTITWIEYMKTGRMQWIYNTLIAFQGMLYIPFYIRNIPQPHRTILELFILVAGFSLSSCYLAYLSSLLLKKIYKSNISSLQDIIDRNMSILIKRYDQFMWNHYGAPEAMKQQSQLVSEEFLVSKRKELNPNYIYSSLEDKIAYYLYQQQFLKRPILKVLENEIVIQVVGGMPMRSYWAFKDLLMNFMDHFLASGLYGCLYTKTLQEAILYGEIQFFATEVSTVEPLNMEYFQICIIILMTGYCMAALCFLVELIVFMEGQSGKNLKK